MSVATIIRMPAIVDILTLLISSAKITINIIKNTPWNTPDKGLFAPELTLTIVLAVVPAIGIQPNRAEIQFAIPREKSSVFGLW